MSSLSVAFGGGGNGEWGVKKVYKALDYIPSTRGGDDHDHGLDCCL